ncbi:glycosyltransferase family 2 protein [Methylobacterium mesophilicum SR1.6/6]|uniref:Glycosyltransferase family 2 protein n=1 Tax=Methylobacterium mesophilicum SR1.6/6 TaxID=908290 RepID=A0A6B9FS27_9HYPH|nr:glycosyltransferase family 2 protein [Methylobacterium mesophilicum]QGY04689.1 glycosyltransferase family 2 protein [Methylobacterium mesophilicum SR1.6/6]
MASEMKIARYLKSYLINGIVAWIRRTAKSRDLACIKLRPELSQAIHVVLMIVKNEQSRIPFFLRYYRNLGFQHFVAIDNCSTDGTREILLQEHDVSLFEAKGGFKSARFGMDWVNHIAAKYCANKWLLHVDADEFLVFEGYKTRKILEFTKDLAARNQISVQCVMLDMYSDRLPSENFYRSGQDPLTICNKFDASGYQVTYDSVSRTSWIKGGVRNRLFFEEISSSPALNKTPLTYWKSHYAFIKCAHELWPPRLNNGDSIEGGPHHGALLHFKFLSDFDSKILNEITSQQHTAEYSQYILGANRAYEKGFVFSETVDYNDWNTLVQVGLISQIYSKESRVTV